MIEGIIKGNGETILLVDDEDMIIDIGEQLLGALNYNTLTAKGGEEAVETYKTNKGNIDLVILDVIMPDLSGDKVYDILTEINPEVKVLISSGYLIDDKTGQELVRKANGFIQKPFNLVDLSTKIREILDENGLKANTNKITGPYSDGAGPSY